MAQSYTTVIQSAARRLAAAGIITATYDATFLAEHAFNLTKTTLLLDADRPAPADQITRYTIMIERRAAHEPAHRILGWREFWGLRFALSPATLEPRPDSETLITTAQRYYPDTAQPLAVLDLGTGTGCLLVSFLHDYINATGTGVDFAAEAVQTASRNAKNHSLEKRCQMLMGDWGADLTDPFDIIFANPPYIEHHDITHLPDDVKNHDPLLALDGGMDGCDAYRALLPDVVRLLADNGHAFIEIGDGQTAHVTDIAAATGLTVVETVADLGGITRCLVLQKII